MKKVLVLGGGFAGVQAAIDLQKSKLFDVTLVSNRDFFFLFPVSIWIPVHKINYDNVKIPLRDIQKKHNFNLLIDRVVGIRAADNSVMFENYELKYDYLVLAFGADKMQHKGLNLTTTICGKPDQTLEFKDKLDALVAKGSGKIAIGFGGNPKDKSAVRGGPAFELIFNIHHYLKKKGLRDKFELNMFAPMAEPGARMGKSALKVMSKMFASQDIHQYFGKKITEFVDDGVLFEDSSKLEADLTMFIPASTGSAILRSSDLPLSEAGFVVINDHTQVTEFPNVFAIGDSAAYEGPDWKAKQGHMAEVMGKVAAHNIILLEKGNTKLKGYQEHLSILCIMDTGNGAAFIYRDSKKEIMIPMPVFGHWVKQAWGHYAKAVKLGKFPQII